MVAHFQADDKKVIVPICLKNLIKANRHFVYIMLLSTQSILSEKSEINFYHDTRHSFIQLVTPLVCYRIILGIFNAFITIF